MSEFKLCAAIDAAPTAVYLADAPDGLALEAPERKSLIERVNRGEHVELEIDAVTYAQGEGVDNRNRTLFTASALNSFAKLSQARHSPFSRNHSLDTSDVGGFVVGSKVERHEGRRDLSERIRLVTPWATTGALNGTMRRFSISWSVSELSDVHCSECKGPVLECGHFPGERLASDRSDAVRLVNYLYRSADPIERSWVTRPAIEETGLNHLVQALSAGHDARPIIIDIGRESMDINKIATALGMTAEATEAGAVERIAQLRADAGELLHVREQLAAVTGERDAAVAELAAVRAARLADDCDRFIEKLVEQGRVRPGSEREKLVRECFARDDRAMAERLASTWEAPAILGPRQSAPSDEIGAPSETNIPSAVQLFAQLPEHYRKHAGNVDPVAYFRANPHLVPAGIALEEVK